MITADTSLATVCVFCGTGSKVDEAYRESARALGRDLAADGVRLVYGGGSVGLMGLVSLSCMEAGGQVTGIIPADLSEREGQNHAITELVLVNSMHERKRMMFDRSDAFVALPGGLGTLEETFEILTWKYLGDHAKPVVLLNINGFYTPLLNMIDHMIKEGFTPAHHRDMFRVVDRVEDILPALRDQMPAPAATADHTVTAADKGKKAAFNTEATATPAAHRKPAKNTAKPHRQTGAAQRNIGT